MLHRLNNAPLECSAPVSPSEFMQKSRHQRDEMQDMQKAIEYLYDFKKKLSDLHPACVDMIENLLQRPRY